MDQEALKKQAKIETLKKLRKHLAKEMVKSSGGDLPKKGEGLVEKILDMKKGRDPGDEQPEEKDDEFEEAKKSFMQYGVKAPAPSPRTKVVMMLGSSGEAPKAAASGGKKK
jgi:hypothetical protein